MIRPCFRRCCAADGLIEETDSYSCHADDFATRYDLFVFTDEIVARRGGSGSR